MKKAIFLGVILVFFPGLLVSEINVYFSHSVDTTYALPNNAQGFVALDEKLIDRIVESQYSIDFCFYDIERQNIVDSLVSAFNGGVEVRVITEHDNISNPAVQDLINAGIPVIDDSFPHDYSGWALMHNKFAIFDFRDSSFIDDDWVWTGSYNMTDPGTEENANNAIEIQDHELARAYTIEFEEMWGSSTNIPDSLNSKFSNYKTDNTEHNFMVGSTPVELYFSPSDSSTEKICDAVLTANVTIYFCIYTFTSQPICDSMKVLWDNNQPDTFSVRGAFDRIGWLSQYSKSRDMTGDPASPNPWNPPAPVFCDSVDKPLSHRLHHKYMIIDVDSWSNPILVTGSQNWTGAGGDDNDENTLIIHSQDIANQYQQEFFERYHEAGGPDACLEKDNVIISKGIRIFPNPFRTILKIESCSEVKVYDVSGRFIAEFENEWDGRDISGKEVKAGIYFLISERDGFGKVIRLRK